MAKQYILTSPQGQGVISGPSSLTLNKILAYSKSLEVKKTSVVKALLVLN
jgi:hypothetical protein